jgi:hypothetical protein
VFLLEKSVCSTNVTKKKKKHPKNLFLTCIQYRSNMRVYALIPHSPVQLSVKKSLFEYFWVELETDIYSVLVLFIIRGECT